MIEKIGKIVITIGISIILTLILIYTNLEEEPKRTSSLEPPRIKVEALYTNYKQYDDRWADYPYSYTTIEIGGCGPAAIANLAYIKNQSSTPIDVADWLTANGYSTYKEGTERKGITSALSYYGYSDIVHTYYSSDIIPKFDSDIREMGIFLVRGSANGITWTATGHYITIYDYTVGGDGLHYMLVSDSSDHDNDGWFCFETQISPCLVEAWMCHY